MNLHMFGCFCLDYGHCFRHRAAFRLTRPPMAGAFGVILTDVLTLLPKEKIEWIINGKYNFG